jgi:foldase protein PrsA
MTMPRRYLAPLGAVFVLLSAFALSACGDSGVPGNSVVKIGDDTIKTSAFDHWVDVAATSAQQQTGATGKAQVPKPPDFAACIAQKAKTAPKPAKGQPKPTNATFKKQCEQEYNGLRDQVLQFLISAAWIQGEAADKGVKVTDAEVKKQFDQQRQQSFPKDADYLNFLKSSGYIQEDLLYRIKVQELSNKLRTKILKGKDKVTDAQIADYYNKNKSRFAQPEKRDLRIVLTKTQAKAEQAKKALESGQSWKSVASKYSIDQASQDNGGLLPGVAKGQQEKALDEATFSAPKGKVSGPVKTQFGYYVFEVDKINKGSQQSLDESKATIKQLLQSQQQQKALDKFVKDFRKKWKDRTDCRKGYVTQDCKNAPKQSGTTATAATPQPNPAPAQQGGTTTGQ